MTAILLTDGEQPNFDNVRLARSACGVNPPVVTITGPPDGSSFTQCDAFGFAGTAVDAEDGDLAASLLWTSSLDGVIGTGGSVPVLGLSAGSHEITASVADSDGLAGTDEISITVTPVPTELITVANSGFETPGLPDGGWTHSTPSWAQISGTSGIFNPTTAEFPAGVPEGENSAYINGGTLSQTITDTLVADSVYTLEVDVGNRMNKPFPGYEIQLLVNGDVRASADQTSVTPADGAFATATAFFKTLPADAGQPLEIRLLTDGEQPNFDNVQLTWRLCSD
jgi:hypothetical protein